MGPMRDHGYNPNCSCPGCQFLWASIEQFKASGPPPVIGTFMPSVGDVGRDCDAPLAQYRTWTGEEWLPSYRLFPGPLATSPNNSPYRRT